MPRGGPRPNSGGARPGAGRPKGSGKKAVQTASPIAEGLAVDDGGLTPIEYMLGVMRDRNADQLRRDRMAVALAPFVHVKKGDLGKKDERKRAAKVAASGKFAPAAPPKLVVNNK